MMHRQFARLMVLSWLIMINWKMHTNMVLNGVITDGLTIKWHFSLHKSQHGILYKKVKKVKIIVVDLV